jgi:NADH:ubiquinone oxidoreductase subunit 4 (subunit M)
MFLTYILLFLTGGIAILFFMDSKKLKNLRHFSLLIASIILIFSCLILNSFDSNTYFFQNYNTYKVGSEILNMSYSFGFDNLSIYFFILSSLLIFICILFIWNDKYFKEYTIALFLIELFLLIIFQY